MFLKKKVLIKVFAFPFLFLVSLFLFLSIIPNISKPAYAAVCTYSGSASVKTGDSFSITYSGFAAGEQIGIWDKLGGTLQQDLGKTQDSLSGSQTLSGTFTVAPGGYSIMIQTRFPIVNFKCGDIDVTSGGKNWNNPGPPPPPFNIMDVFQPAKRFGSFGQLASDILLILVSLAGALALIFIIISGFKFVTSSGDEKKLASAKATLAYAIIGIAVVILAFVIVQVLQYFLQSSIPVT